MTLDEAKVVLRDIIEKNGHLFDEIEYVAYPSARSTKSNPIACLDGNFTADYLEAIAVYMRANPG